MILLILDGIIDGTLVVVFNIVGERLTALGREVGWKVDAIVRLLLGVNERRYVGVGFEVGCNELLDLMRVGTAYPADTALELVAAEVVALLFTFE